MDRVTTPGDPRRERSDLVDVVDKRPQPWLRRSWKVGILVLVGIIGLPTVGLIATNHLLRQADERRVTQSNALAATAVAYEVAQSYQQRVQVLQDLPDRPSVALGLAQRSRSLLAQSLQTALTDGNYCRLELRSPGIDPVTVSGPGPCWSPPAPPGTVNNGQVRAVGVATVGSRAFAGLSFTGAVSGQPTTVQAVFAIDSLTAAVIPGAGTHATVVDGMTIVSSTAPGLVGKMLAAPAARALVRAGRTASNTIYAPLIHAEVLETFHPVPRTGLGVFYSVTTKAAYAATRHVSRLLLIGYVALVFIGLALAGLVVVMLRRRDQSARLAQQALRESEERLRVSFESAPIGKALIGLDGHYLRVNPAMCALTGYPETEMLQMTFREIAHPDDLADELAARDRLLTGDQATYAIETRYLTRTGGTVWVSTSGTLVRTGTGSPLHYIAQVQDITERLEHEQALAQERRRLRDAESIGHIGSWERNIATNSTIWSDTFLELYGLDPAHVADDPSAVAACIHPDDKPRVDAAIRDCGESGEPVQLRYRATRANDGELRWLELSARRDNPGGRLAGAVIDVTVQVHAEEALLHQSLHDPLTGLANRTLLFDRINHALAASTRSHIPVGVLYIDLDGFKQINDSAGHTSGDQLLVQVADRLRRTTRPGDTIARIGGDEFVLVCVEVADLDGLHAVATRALKALCAPFQLATGTHHISASIGVALSDESSATDQLMSAADAAMYAAKHAGKNRISAPHAEEAARAARTSRLLPQLHDAINNDQLIMYGQPVVDLATGTTVAVETLIRWQHPVRGVLPPSEFLDIAEHSPLVIPLGQRALTESCRIAATWNAQLGVNAPDLHVNVSGRQLESGHLTRDVLNVLEASSLPAAKLVLELTETHTPAITDSLLTDIDQLRERGVRIAIDDLGTGYSSLARITQLPVDILKIDLRFTAGLGRDPACDAVVRAILNLGHAMGLSVVAEGVETLEQADLLRTYGCTTVQGYLYSRPQPEAELYRYLGEHTDAARLQDGAVRGSDEHTFLGRWAGDGERSAV